MCKVLFFFLSLLFIFSLSLADISLAAPQVQQKKEFIQKGLKVEFLAGPFPERKSTQDILEGEYAFLKFKITSAETGEPVSTLKPAAWIDLVKETNLPVKRSELTCIDKARLYLQGTISFRPDIDLNSYYILTLNNDATISVIDPIVSISGITQLYAMAFLKKPGEDWVLNSDEKKLFITMPKAAAVAVVNTENFKTASNIDTGKNPVRIAFQPDSKYLWVGNDSTENDESGVTVIDSENEKIIAKIPTGKGHHEIAFSANSLYAFITNKDDGTLSVIDTQKLKKIKDVKTGKKPSSIVFSDLSRAVYVADEDDGTITIIDSEKHEIANRLMAKSGLKSLRFAPGGRWGFAVNSKENCIYIFDASKNSIVHTVEAGKEPDQVSFTKTNAYVRSKGTADVILIQLSTLGKEGSLGVIKIQAGQKAPGEFPYNSFADAIFPTLEGDTVLITNPADSFIYYFAEGMASPMGSFSNYGHVPKAVCIVDRSLNETEKGLYTAKVKIPKSGKYQVALLIDSPWIVDCFEFEAMPNPLLKGKNEAMSVKIEFLTKERISKTGENYKLQFKLSESSENKPITGSEDILVTSTLASGMDKERFLARHIGNGVYESNITFSKPGVYYLFFSSISLKVAPPQLPYLILNVKLGENTK